MCYSVIFYFRWDRCIQRIKYDAEINDLRKKIAAQNDTTEYYNRRIEELKTDKNIIEQVAREQYLMSKPNIIQSGSSLNMKYEEATKKREENVSMW